MWEEEKIETADMHGGKFAVFEYEFRARGPEHPLAINGEDWGPRGSDVAAKWHIEWPEEGAGLSGEALMKVRKRILKMASGDEAEQSETGQEGAETADIWRKVAALKARAMKEYKCNPEEEYHLCSRWEYIADKEGIKWTWDPYSLLAGCYGAPAVTIPWEELAPFSK